MEQLFRPKRKLGKISLFYFPYILFLPVGPTWSRKMMEGFLKSRGIDAGDRRVGKVISALSLGCIRWQYALIFKEIYKCISIKMKKSNLLCMD